MAELALSPNSGRTRTALRVDLTAMVDLAFLLVTFFMLTTTLSKPKAMDLAMPVKGADGGAVPESRTVTLCIGSNNHVYLYRGLLDHPISKPQIINMDKNGLRASLLNIKQQLQQATGKDVIAIVKPSAHSKYGSLVNVIDELNITQIATYAVENITDKEVDVLQAKHIY